MRDFEQRDWDIRTLAIIRSRIDLQPGAYFVLTGSYSVEALTRSSLFHNDIDANVFISQPALAQKRIAKSLACLPLMNKTVDTESYLEYEVLVPQGDGGVRTVELNLLPVNKTNSALFQLRKPEHRISEVPTEIRTLTTSTGEEFSFRVKSLSYAIASWALRISGLLREQKRSVRDSDLDHFRQLLLQSYDYQSVLSTMSKHPQMEDYLDADLVFKQSLARL